MNYIVYYYTSFRYQNAFVRFPDYCIFRDPSPRFGQFAKGAIEIIDVYLPQDCRVLKETHRVKGAEYKLICPKKRILQSCSHYDTTSIHLPLFIFLSTLFKT